MTQQSHSPKFGNLQNGDNALFNDARKGNNGGKMINLNDRQQKPEIFPIETPSSPMKATSSQSRFESNVHGGKNRSANSPRPSWESKLSGSNHGDVRRHTDSPLLQDPVVRRTNTDPHHQQHSDVRESTGDNSKRPVRQTGSGPERDGIEKSPRPSWESKTPGNNRGDVRRQTDFPSLQDPVVRRTTTYPQHQQRSDVREGTGDNSRRPVRQTGAGAERRGVELSPRAGGKGGILSSPLWERKTSEINHGLAQNTGTSRVKSPGNTSTIPKLGDWDESDPSGGEGFTGIFERVKEDRDAEKANIISMPSSTPNRQMQDHVNPKMRCCFF